MGEENGCLTDDADGHAIEKCRQSCFYQLLELGRRVHLRPAMSQTCDSGGAVTGLQHSRVPSRHTFSIMM